MSFLVQSMPAARALSRTLREGEGAAKLTVDQWTKQRAFCEWCLAAAGATFAALPAVMPEATAAWRRLRRK